MEPIIVSLEDCNLGNYPKDVPVMVEMNMVAEGKGGLSTGYRGQKITIKMTRA